MAHRDNENARNAIVQIGQRIHCILYGGRDGTVYAIHGEQCPASVGNLGGVITHGGKAHFDIVFDDGSQSLHLPESILRGVQWRIYPRIEDSVFIAQALAYAASVQASKKAAGDLARKRFEEDCERLRGAAFYGHLRQGDDRYSGKLAAANMRIQLKRAFPGVRFSVRMSSYGSVSVGWVDGPTVKKLEAIVLRYKAGSFNGMEDIYESNVQPWHAVFGGVDYVNTHRQHSEELVGRALQAVYAEYPGNLEGVPMPAPDLYARGLMWSIEVPGLADNLQRLVSKFLEDLE